MGVELVERGAGRLAQGFAFLARGAGGAPQGYPQGCLPSEVGAAVLGVGAVVGPCDSGRSTPGCMPGAAGEICMPPFTTWLFRDPAEEVRGYCGGDARVRSGRLSLCGVERRVSLVMG